MLDFRKKLNWLRTSSPTSVVLKEFTDEFMNHILKGLIGVVQQEDLSQPFIIIITQTNSRRIVADYLNNSTLKSECICSVEVYEKENFFEYFFDSIVERFKEKGFEVTMCNDSAYIYIP